MPEAVAQVEHTPAIIALERLPVLVEVIGMSPVWGQTLFAVAVIITSYFWHSNVTFAPSSAK